MNKNAIICSAHINALGLVKSLRNIGFKGNIICISTGVKRKYIPEYYPKLCRTIHLYKKDYLRLPEWIEKNYPLTDNINYVFFTNERFHYQFYNKYGKNPPKNLVYKLGVGKKLDVVCDKLKFYEFIEEKGLIDTPKTISSNTNDPFEIFGSSFFIRPRLSWKGTREVPRGIVIKSEEDLKRSLALFKKRAIDKSDYSYQELLDTRPKNNISISGWHDNSFKKYFTTRPLYRMHSGTALAVEFCRAPDKILKITEDILNELNYNGPFEMEFIKIKNSKNFKIIEINPRFWLQHSLFQHVYNNYLTRKYLNLELDFKKVTKEHCWVNTIEVLTILYKMRFNVLEYVNSNSIFYPDWNVAVRYLLPKKQKKKRQ